MHHRALLPYRIYPEALHHQASLPVLFEAQYCAQEPLRKVERSQVQHCNLQCADAVLPRPAAACLEPVQKRVRWHG